jgi:dipeptidyl aminopeptidase/acylaminoacyl peptidase
VCNGSIDQEWTLETGLFVNLLVTTFVSGSPTSGRIEDQMQSGKGGGKTIRHRAILLGISLLWMVPAFPQTRTGRVSCRIGGPGFDPTPVQIPSVVGRPSRRITSLDLVTIRDLKGVQVSPDGKSVAFVVSQAVYKSNSYRTGLFLIGTEPGSKAVSLGSAGPPRWNDIGEYLPEPPSWSPDSRYITYRLKRGETWQVWRWNRKGGGPVQLTHSRYNVESFRWRRDGKSIIFEVERPRDPEDARRLSERGILYDGSIDPSNGKPIVDAELHKEPVERETWIYELATGKESKATAQEIARDGIWHKDWEDNTQRNIYMEKPSPDGKALAFTRWLDDEERKSRRRFNSLFVRPAGGGQSIDLTAGMDVSSIPEFWWAADGSQIYFQATFNGGRPPSFYVVASRGGSARELVRFDGWFSQSSLDAKTTLAAGVRGNTTIPDEVAVADLKTGAIRTLVNVNPEFNKIHLSPVARIEWKTEDGEIVSGYLIKPLDYEAGKTYPLIVTTYRAGQGFQRGAVGDEYPMQVFAANGFAVLAFNVGLTPGFESGNFEEAKKIWFSLIPSLEAAVKVAQDMGIADPLRKGITGLSYGERIVDFVISHSDLFQAGIASGLGFDDPYTFYLLGSNQKAQTQLGLGGWPEGASSARWREVSPALNAQHVKAPLLVNAAESEFRRGLQFYLALKEFRKPVEVFVYPDESHEKNQPKHRFEIYQRNLDWFRFWFKGEEDSGLAKAKQYKRWRELRKLNQENENISSGPPTALH